MNIHLVSQAVDNLWGQGIEARKEAAKYLTSLDPAEALPILRQLLFSSNIERQLSAAEAMLIIDCSTTVAEVLFLLDSPEAWVRRHVCGFLLDYGHAEAFEDLIRLAESDPDPNVRAMACETLGWIGDARCIEPLRMIACQADQEDLQGEPVRNHAATALATLAARFAGTIESKAGCR